MVTTSNLFRKKNYQFSRPMFDEIRIIIRSKKTKKKKTKKQKKKTENNRQLTHAVSAVSPHIQNLFICLHLVKKETEKQNTKKTEKNGLVTIWLTIRGVIICSVDGVKRQRMSNPKDN